MYKFLPKKNRMTNVHLDRFLLFHAIAENIDIHNFVWYIRALEVR